jgi:hypothetical protein
MESASTETTDVASPAGRRPVFLLGVAIFLAGPAIYAVQVGRLHQLHTPWYVPILGTAGVVLMSLAAWRHSRVLTKIGLFIFIMLCGLEWFFLLQISRLPEYTGPVEVGGKLPPFSTTRADDERPLTEKNFELGTAAVIVFYRGHW